LLQYPFLWGYSFFWHSSGMMWRKSPEEAFIAKHALPKVESNGEMN